jgi:hypothetical protein
MMGYSLNRVPSYPSARHHKLNLCSVLDKETVEFRQHQSTVNETELCEWIVLTQLMVTRAKQVKTNSEMKDISLNSFIRVLGLSHNNNPFGIMDSIQERYHQNKANEQQATGHSLLQDGADWRKSRNSNHINRKRKYKYS